MNLMLTLHTALFAVKDGLQQMVHDYDTAEELNNMTAKQLGDAMSGPWSKIKKISDYGQSEGTNSGGN
jgi:hypothetical protein